MVIVIILRIALYFLILAPSHPPENVSVSIMDPTSAQFSWTIPPLWGINGIIRHFSLKIQEKNTTSRNFTFLAEHLVFSSPLMVADLHPFYNYSVMVAAETVGLGPYSDEILWQMPEDGNRIIHVCM